MRHWSDVVLMLAHRLYDGGPKYDTGIFCAIFTQEKLFAICLINNITFKVLGLIKNFFDQGVLHAELIKYFNLSYVYAFEAENCAINSSFKETRNING